MSTAKNEILTSIAETIEIPDSAYQSAEDRYKDLGAFLTESGSHSHNYDTHIFAQGSFRLGTVIRPLSDDEEYDLDLSCELKRGYSPQQHSQRDLKHLLGLDLEKYRLARRIEHTKEEKNRCWRLRYKDQLRFHMDVVPCLPESAARKLMIKEAMMRFGSNEALARLVSDLSVIITDRTHPRFGVVSPDWPISNPEGYARWLESRMKLATAVLERRVLEAKAASIDKLPAYRWKTPLQQAIQLLKRHRDVMFKNNPDAKPISIIITTLAGHCLNQRAMDAAALAEWIDSLINSVPAPDEAGLVDLQSLAHAARTFVNEHVARASALDHVAATALNDAIAELEGLGPFRCPMTEALRFIRERAESVTIAADRPRPGHLLVTPLSGAGWSGRPHVFVVGLEEGRVFPLTIEDPVLLDVERGQIHDALLRSYDRTQEAVHGALSRLAAITANPNARVTLSYACRDVREYRQTFASWVLLQAFRVVSSQVHATFHDLLRHLGEPESIVPKSPAATLDESRWWLHGIIRTGESAREPILTRYPSLAAGIEARERRESPDFTEFDGHVPAAGAALDPGLPDSVISPTQLEEAAECPFRYFLKRGLGVDAIESGERDRDIWLTPLLRGSLLHDLYAALLRRCRTERRRAEVCKDSTWLRDEGMRMLTALAIEMPPPSIEIRDRETSLLLEDLSVFLEAEVALPTNRTPVGFEVEFGRAGEDSGEPLAQADPVVINIGGLSLRIAGRIDRIDQVGPSTFEIIDYKTGGYFAPNWIGTFAGGTRLQHALYGLAAVELLRRRHDPNATVTGAEYYFSSTKGGQERKRIPAPPLAAIAQVLSDLRQVIASGLFVHAPSEAACKWCDHGLACGRGVQARANAKHTDVRLEPFVRLAQHE